MTVEAITWIVQVDWTGDPGFGSLTDETAYVMSLSWNRGRSSATEDYGAGTASFTLDNSAGRFSPFNTIGALYGSLVPGKPIRFFAQVSATPYPVFSGFITEIAETVSPEGGNVVTIQAADAFARLSRGTIRVALQESKRVDEILTTILAEVNLAITTVFNTALETLDFFWVHNSSPLEALKKAAKQELGGYIYMSNVGYLYFKNREARSKAAVLTTLTGPRMLTMPLREADIIDEVRLSRAGITADPDTAVIYNLFPARLLAVGSTDPTNTVNGEYPAGSAKNVVTPVAVTDYTANSAVDGTGTDMTASVTVAFTNYGGGFQAVFTNLDSNPVYLTLFQVRGESVRVSAEERLITISNTGAAVRDQAFTDSFEFNDNADAIKAYGTFLLGAMSGAPPLPRGTVDLSPRTTAELTAFLTADLGARITLTNTTGQFPSKANADFFVESISGQSVPGLYATFSWGLMHESLVMGDFFRISGAGSPAYSTINGSDRVAF